MSRWIRVSLAVGLIAAATVASAAPFRVVTSFYPMYVATLNIVAGAEGVEVVNLTKPFTGCLHDVQLTPAEMVTLSGANALVINGAGMESFMDKALQVVARDRVIDASDGLDLLDDNAHVWLSVSLHLRQVDNIAAGLERLDPARAAVYRANAAAYTAKLEALRDRMHEGLRDLPQRDIVTFHEAFPYFAKEFDLRIAAVIEREPGTEPAAAELAQTIDLVRASGVKALFAEPQYPARAAESIARETGARVYTLDPAVTGPMDADAYIHIMDANLRVLEEALK